MSKYKRELRSTVAGLYGPRRRSTHQFRDSRGVLYERDSKGQVRKMTAEEQQVSAILSMAQTMVQGSPMLALPNNRMVRVAQVVEIDYSDRSAVKLTYSGGAQSTLDAEQSQSLLLQTGIEKPLVQRVTNLAAVPELNKR